MPEDNNNDEPVVQGDEHQFLEGDEHSGTHAEHRLKVRVGEKEEDVYTEEGREEMVSTDEIEPWEEGFSKGAQKAVVYCARCKTLLGDRQDKIIEREFQGTTYLFCSDKCAGAGPLNE